MKKSSLLIWVLAVAFLSFFVSCSKDDDEPEPQQQQAPTFSTKTVAVPDAMMQSSDEGAQEAVAYVNLANSFTGLANSFIPPQKCAPYKSTNDGPPWIYTWEVIDGEDQYTVTLTISQTSSGYEWDMVIDGTIDGIVVNNFLFMHGELSNDGKNGLFTLYDFETGEICMYVTWNTDDNGVYSVTFEIPEDIKVNVTSNLDGSGDVEVYEWENGNYQLEWKAVWTSDGHGEWWSYENGVLVDHGTW